MKENLNLKSVFFQQVSLQLGVFLYDLGKMKLSKYPRILKWKTSIFLQISSSCSLIFFSLGFNNKSYFTMLRKVTKFLTKI